MPLSSENHSKIYERIAFSFILQLAFQFFDSRQLPFEFDGDDLVCFSFSNSHGFAHVSQNIFCHYSVVFFAKYETNTWFVGIIFEFSIVCLLSKCQKVETIWILEHRFCTVKLRSRQWCAQGNCAARCRDD